jgi:hypothetical protein
MFVGVGMGSSVRNRPWEENFRRLNVGPGKHVLFTKLSVCPTLVETFFFEYYVGIPLKDNRTGRSTGPVHSGSCFIVGEKRKMMTRKEMHVARELVILGHYYVEASCKSLMNHSKSYLGACTAERTPLYFLHYYGGN